MGFGRGGRIEVRNLLGVLKGYKYIRGYGMEKEGRSLRNVRRYVSEGLCFVGRGE